MLNLQSIYHNSQSPLIQKDENKLTSSDNTEPTLREGTRLLTQGTNPVARVLKPIYSGATGVNYIVYNDAPPDGSQTQAPRAHAKGSFSATLTNLNLQNLFQQ